MGYMDKPLPGTNKAAGGHGAGLRGDQRNYHPVGYKGKFRKMFPTLPPVSFSDNDLTALSWAMTSPPERLRDNPVHIDYLFPKAPREVVNGRDQPKIQDDEENFGIDAGYTYFGQFIDHDITFDPASLQEAKNDPDADDDFRTPALDLDSLYGGGPADQPYMFEPDGKSFILGRPLTQNNVPSASRDLPRIKGNASHTGQPARAIIGDKRNDENVIVSQLQAVFLQFHNRLVAEHNDLSFEEIRKLVQWHYQWVVAHDFLPTMVGEKTMKKIWPTWSVSDGETNLPTLKYYKVPQGDRAYIPLEFAVAAYRFGHSMVRPIYRLNTHLHGGQNPNMASPKERDEQGIDGRFFIFAGVQNRGLNGFDEFPSQWAIDWSLFFDIKGSGEKKGKARVQPAYKIDASIVNPLAFLPEFSQPTFVSGGAVIVNTLQMKEANPKSPSNLAVRNLWRGNSKGLPSGQVLAEAMGETPIAANNIRLGKALVNEQGKFDENELVAAGKVPAVFNQTTPLWLYVLGEAEYEWRQNADAKAFIASNDYVSANRAVPVTLGAVGGTIVAETLIGLLLADSSSYLCRQPTWKPTVPKVGATFKISDLIAYALHL